MTKRYRCIICELVWDEADITYCQICKTCESSSVVTNNNERRRRWHVFCRCHQELFYMEHTEPNHAGVVIPSDDEVKCKIIKQAKNNLALRINQETKWKEDMETRNDTSSQSYKDTVANIVQMEQIVPLAVNLESRYCKK